MRIDTQAAKSVSAAKPSIQAAPIQEASLVSVDGKHLSNVQPLLLVALTVSAFIVFAFLQFSTDGFVDVDSYYHSQVATLIWEGRLEPFFWLPRTVLNTASYVDHHFLFHVVLAPLSSISPPVGSKLGAVFCATAVFLTIVGLIPVTRARQRVFYALLFFAMSADFLYRMSMVRAQSLSLVVLLLTWHAAAQRKYWTVGVLSFVYVWLYNAFPLLVLLTASFVLAQYLENRRIAFALPLVVVLGITAGVVINPFFPQNVVFLWHHLVDKFNPAGFTVRVGSEWYSYSLSEFVKHAGLPLLLVGLALHYLASTPRRNVSTTTACILAVITGIMVFRAKRFIELFPPVALLAFGTALHQWSLQVRPGFTYSRGVFALVCSAFIATLVAVYSDIARVSPYHRYSSAAHWLRTHSEDRELVWLVDWDLFPPLFHHNDKNAYLAGLDPYFYFAADPAEFKDWVALTNGEYQGPIGPYVRSRFGARYLFIDTGHSKLRSRLDSDPSIRRLFHSKDSSVYGAWPSTVESGPLPPPVLPQ